MHLLCYIEKFIFIMTTDKSPTPYGCMLQGAQRQISAEIKQIRDSLSHSGEKGDLIERVFRKRLSEVLPEKVGVSNGFVLDSKRKISKQMDIVLYDRPNTPRIFTSAGAQMFPVEMTFACGEIKTKIDVTQLENCFEKCNSYKELERCAYYTENSDGFNWPSIFFCISEECVNVQTLLEIYDDIVTKRHEFQYRIDTIVGMQQTSEQNGVVLLNSISENGYIQSIDLLPSPGTKSSVHSIEEPWALFVNLLLSYMTRAKTNPVDMTEYYGNMPF